MQVEKQTLSTQSFTSGRRICLNSLLMTYESTETCRTRLHRQGTSSKVQKIAKCLKQHAEQEVLERQERFSFAELSFDGPPRERFPSIPMTLSRSDSISSISSGEEVSFSTPKPCTPKKDPICIEESNTWSGNESNSTC